MEQTTVTEVVHGTAIAGCFLWFVVATFFGLAMMMTWEHGNRPYVVAPIILCGAALNATIFRWCNTLPRKILVPLVLISAVLSAAIAGAVGYLFYHG
jgi:hypothetical protein